MQATFTWAAAEYGNKDPHLVVTRAGAPAFDGSPIAAGSPCAEPEPAASFAASGKRDAPLQVVDLDADGEPEVLVDTYTGGAHCCALTEILRFNGSDVRAVRGLVGQHRLRAEGPQRRRAPGVRHRRRRLLLRLHSFAGSLPPAARPRLRRRGQGLVQRRDAPVPGAGAQEHEGRPARAGAGAPRPLRDLGAVSAYVADLYLLGRGREVRPYLQRARKRGDLRNATGRAPKSFDRRLLAFLHKQGYR